MEGWPKFDGDWKECFKQDENGANDSDDNESWVISKGNKENPLMVLFMMSLMTIPTEHTSAKIEFDDGDHWDDKDHWDGEESWNFDDDLAAALEKAGYEISCGLWKG